MSILLVEDDQALANGLKRALEQEGLIVNIVHKGQDALDITLQDAPDTMILDLGLPDMDGLAVLNAIRARKSVFPILLLTARDTFDDKVTGLDCGADDYLAKPFNMAELLARIRALGRRHDLQEGNTLRIGAVTLSINERCVQYTDNPVSLSRREYVLLKTLMENAGRVLTRDRLETNLYAWGEEVASNALEVHIHNLRKKLGNQFITTIRGVGYTIPRQ